MRYLLDTHVLIWYVNGDQALPHKYLELIANPENQLYISKASLWEITIKLSLKKLKIDISFNELESYLQSKDFRILDLSFDHFNKLLTLPPHHGDPFDRLLIAQAQAEEITIISTDRHFTNYRVSVMW